MHSLLAGLLATVASSILFCGWLATGSLFHQPGDRVEPIDVAAYVLIGSSLSAFLIAISSAAGFARSGAGIVAMGLVALTVARRFAVVNAVRSIAAPIRPRQLPPSVAVATAITALALWLSATAPPRNADAMRYHLAHVAQIAKEGRWVPVADFHYALPFGWTFNYLPFELVGIPEASQVLSVILAVVIYSGLRRLAAGKQETLAVAAIAALFAHPFLVRTFSEPGLDAYSFLVMWTISALLLRLQRLSKHEWLILGFAAWVGIQSRYQLVAAGLMTTLLAGAYFISVKGSRVPARNFLLGACAAIVLASPFYIANALAFGNPVWPLMIGLGGDAATYADIVAAGYAKALRGDYGLGEIATATRRVLFGSVNFPLALVVAACVGFGFRSRVAVGRRVAWFAAGFFGLWLLTQPRLYPRFIILLVPPAAVLLVLLTENVPVRKGLLLASRWLALALAVISFASSGDYVRYHIDGNKTEYHRYTWYHPVYTWINGNLPQSTRALVIVSSGHSYYLDRYYRRADPFLSGVVDWTATSNGQALDSVLARGCYDIVVYHDRDWKDFAGGDEMMAAMTGAVRDGLLVPISQFKVPLYTSRVMRRRTIAKVVILRRTGSVLSSCA